MRLPLLLSAALLAGSAAAAPTPTPSQLPDDGFPDPSPSQLAALGAAADGTLSDAPPPPALNSSSLPIFQLIAFNENFEVAFFNSLLYNVSHGVPGFGVPWGVDKLGLVRILSTVLAQEELHAINAAGVLQRFNGTVPAPCTYRFPTTDLAGALALAETFTSVVLGTLQDAAQGLAVNGDAGPVRAVASVLGQEGEQNGFFRSLLNRKPSEKPFLTTSVAAFAFSALQDFVVACPFDLAAIPIPRFPTIRVLTGDGSGTVPPQDQLLTFSADLSGVAAAAPYYANTSDSLFVTYFTGQDAPVSVPVTTAVWSADGLLTFQAAFPYAQFVMDGLSIAALTTAANFSSPDDVPAATLAAPALIQVNDPIV